MSDPQTPVDERQIRTAVKAVRAGDRAAFGLIVSTFQESIMTLAMVILKDHHAAQDAAQDAFIQAFLHLNTFDDARPIKPWLLGITWRVAMNHRRNRARRTEVESAAIERSTQIQTGSSPLESSITAETKKNLWNMVEQLSEREQLAVILFYREGLSVDEAARTMEVSSGTVKTLLFRARRALSARLQPGTITSIKEGLT